MFDLILGFKTSSLLIPTHTASSSHTHTHTHSATHTSTATWIPALPTVEKVDAVGVKTLWFVFAIMLLSSLAFGVLAYRVPVQKRLFHILTTFTTLFTTLSYFAMATGYSTSGHGNSFSATNTHNHTTRGAHQILLRQIFWARYISFALSTPLILLNLSLLAGLNGANILLTLLFSLIMVLSSLFGAYGSTPTEKWSWYTISLLFYVLIIFQLAIPGRRAVKSKGTETKKLFAAIATYTLIVWTLYPVVWALGEGKGNWSVDAGVVGFAVLDVLAIPVFGAWLLWGARNDLSVSGPIIEGFWSHGLGLEGGIRIVGDEGA